MKALNLNYSSMLSNEEILEQIPYCLKGTDFSGLGNRYEGKVRDNYSKDGKRFLIATDRLSAFDRVITLIPFKGQVLNQMAEFWFKKTSDIVGNHVIEFPDPNVVLARECKPLPLEMVVRGYLTGVTSTSVWTHYKNGGRNFCGNELPEGMKWNQMFENPILTPSTKAEHGDHDESVSPEELLKRTGLSKEKYDFVADVSLRLFARGQEVAAKQGIILVDTKYEFGEDEDGNIVLIDEIHTPDSSRFWFSADYQKLFEAGEDQKKVDKEYLRRWLAEEKNFTGEGEVPEVPVDVRVETARRYIEAYELVTGQSFDASVGDVYERVKKSLNLT
jgi:phosphoribosylaminoimidazole-succinocarboxamide synthase